MIIYTIGQLASEAGVPTSTIRYYERRGLLRPESRSAGNYRIYGAAALEHLQFVRSAQAAGFTLADITELLGLQNANIAPCREVQDLISTRLDLVGEQIKQLKTIDRMLRKWMAVCCDAENSGRCGVLVGLQSTKTKECGSVSKKPLT